MKQFTKLSDKFLETIHHEGVVSIVSWSNNEVHVVNTWNSFLEITEHQQILIPVHGFRKTEKNININNQIKITLGSRNVLGHKDYQGTGFLINGTARFIRSGREFDFMKEKFSFINRVLEITVTSIKQTL